MRSGAPPGAVANESGLKSLGDTIKRSGGRRRSGKAKWSSRRKIVTVLSSLIVLALVITGGGLYYFNHVLGSLTNLNIPDETAVKNGAPFTILVIGSDSRVGQNSSYFGSSSAVTGQRSDVLQLWRVTPSSSSIQIISIPRDTVVSMIGADVNQFGRYNRINSSFNTGPNQLVKTIQANFGLPINHVVELDFSGFENAVTALGGVYLNFNYPAKDAYSGLNITTPGCQLVTGFQALAVARARHYEYYKNGYWQYDGTSDFGRIQRQDAFIRALITAAKSKETDPLAAIHFLSSLHEGLSLDHGFSSSEVIGLFETYHSFNPAGLVAQTLPTVAANGFGSLGDVLTVDQPAGEQMLSNVFGSDLGTPNSPPPDSAGNPNPPPVVTPTTAAPPVAGAPSGTTTPTTTPPEPYNPTPCSPA
jgi:LCP family protein required for cell wall assembly